MKAIMTIELEAETADDLKSYVNVVESNVHGCLGNRKWLTSYKVSSSVVNDSDTP